MISINGLNKSFGKKKVLDNISFTFDNGVYGLLGPNGAGKTTLIRCMSTNYPVKNDEILSDDISINKNKNYLEHIGYLPQKFGMFKELKVYDMMELFVNLKGIAKKDSKEEILKALELVNLTDRKDSLVGALSGGMIRRLGIAQAILGDPRLILFDEPTAGLDPEERLRFKNIVTQLEKDKTIIISTHIVEDVEAVCDKVAIMKDKKIHTCGTCEEIQAFAKDKAYLVKKGEEEKIKGAYEVQKYFEQSGISYLKILTGTPQAFEKTEPNVEDGYICILKSI